MDIAYLTSFLKVNKISIIYRKDASQILIDAIFITNPKKLEFYHCLIGDGYCIFDLFSQSQCNTFEILKYLKYLFTFKRKYS